MIEKESSRGFLNMKTANQMHGFPPETKFEQSSMEGMRIIHTDVKQVGSILKHIIIK